MVISDDDAPAAPAGPAMGICSRASVPVPSWALPAGPS
jgi:hypothetical protein